MTTSNDTKPTQEQITNEIKLLKEIKPTVRKFSMFGDDLQEAIDTQISVLSQNLNENGIWDRYPDNSFSD